MMELPFYEQRVNRPLKAKSSPKMALRLVDCHEKHEFLRKNNTATPNTTSRREQSNASFKSIHALANTLNHHQSSRAAPPYQQAAYYPASPPHAA